jgi:hypothetical protein
VRVGEPLQFQSPLALNGRPRGTLGEWPAEFGICAEAIVAIVGALVIGSLDGLIGTF